jgi:hypothetical protein
MTDLAQQTEQLLKAFTTLHNDLSALRIDIGIAVTVIVALLVVIAFRRRR